MAGRLRHRNITISQITTSQIDCPPYGSPQNSQRPRTDPDHFGFLSPFLCLPPTAIGKIAAEGVGNGGSDGVACCERRELARRRIYCARNCGRCADIGRISARKRRSCARHTVTFVCRAAEFARIWFEYNPPSGVALTPSDCQ